MIERASVDGLTLEYEVVGSGDPVVLIHGSHIADTFATLMAEPVLSEHFRLIRYRRRGFAGSSSAENPLPVSTQAADCLALLRQLGVQRAHVVGHSYGGAIALQLALDAPESVRSLSLLEPALLGVPSGPQLLEQIERIVTTYEAGDRAGAVDAFLTAVCGKAYRTAVESALPGAMGQAVADADTFFGVELPALGEWTFSGEDAARVKQPVLAVLGADSDTVFGEGNQLLLDWFPQAKRFVLPRAAHLLHVQNPGDMARALAGFLSNN